MNKKDFKYNTAEYFIAEASEKMEQALHCVKSVRKEIGQIQPVSKIVLGGGSFLGPEPRIKYNFNTVSLESFFNPKPTYSSWEPKFDPLLSSHIATVVNNSLAFAAEAEKEIEVWHKENIEAIENNKKVAEQIKDFISSVGIPSTYTANEVVRGKSKSIAKMSGYVDDISRNCIIEDNYEYAKRIMVEFRKRVADWEKNILGVAKAQKDLKEKEDKKIRLIARAMEIYRENRLTEKYSTNDELVRIATEAEKEKWVKENYPDGEIVDQKACQDCSTWVVGERRCECGNRRLEIQIEGNILDGFAGYVEAY